MTDFERFAKDCPKRWHCGASGDRCTWGGTICKESMCMAMYILNFRNTSRLKAIEDRSKALREIWNKQLEEEAKCTQ